MRDITKCLYKAEKILFRTIIAKRIHVNKMFNFRFAAITILHMKAITNCVFLAENNKYINYFL